MMPRMVGFRLVEWDRWWLTHRCLEEDQVFTSERNKDFGLGHIEFKFKVSLRHTRSDVKNAVQY